MPVDIKILDNSFGDPSMSKESWDSPIRWRKDYFESDLVVFTDNYLHLAWSYPCKHKVAILIEPEAISPNTYRYVRDNPNIFDVILTHNLDFRLKSNDQGLISYYNFGSTWIKKEDWKIYPKSKKISIIASSKNYTEGHRIRHEIIREFKDKIDVFGYGYKPLDYKLEGLKDYEWHIAIENSFVPGYFTEKLIDAIAVGCCPIYLGDPSIMPFENIVSNSNKWELMATIEAIVENQYNPPAFKEELQRNLDLAMKEYNCPEKSIYNSLKGLGFIK